MRNVHPVAAARAHLEPRLSIDQEKRERAVIGMRARPDLARSARPGGIAQEPERRERGVEMRAEMVLGQPEITGDGPVEIHAEAPDGVEVAEHGGAEAGEIGPDVEAPERLAPEHAGVVGFEFEADVEGLLAVDLSARLVEPFRPRRDPAAVVGISPDRELLLVGTRQVEEPVGLAQELLLQRAADAVASQEEEPRVAAGAAEHGGEPVRISPPVPPVERRDHASASSRLRAPPVKRSIFAATRARCARREASVELSMR